MDIENIQDLRKSDKAESAIGYFKEGYSCSQSVLLAFCEEYGLDKETAVKLSSSFGAGMGRLREVCGAVSGMFMVAGLAYGYTDPKDHTGKSEHYERIQYLAREFEEKNHSIICRELLGSGAGKDNPEPEKRTAEYYQKRPCADLVGMAAEIMEKYIVEQNMELQITTLIENQPDDNAELLCEHGLSLYIEADGKKILFDTGQSGDFMKNAGSLGKDLNTLDYCILSHGHYDHTGGLECLVRETSKLPKLVVGEEFFRDKYKAAGDGEYKFNGNSFSQEYLEEIKADVLKVREDMIELSENILVFHHFEKHNDFEQINEKFCIKSGDGYIQDDFADEIAMGIRTKKGLVVVVGCSHVGIVNMIKTISDRTQMPIYAVIGGTHLVHGSEERIDRTIEVFQEMGIQMVAVSHCTGEDGIQKIQEGMVAQFVQNNTGHIIRV